MKIYLSGSIKKGTDDDKQKSYWTEEDMVLIRKILSSYNEVVFLNPAERNDDLSDSKSTFGRDLLQVYMCDIVFVDARDGKGLGIGSEMTFAKLLGIPVVSIAPENTKYNKTNFEYLGQKIEHWIHPFVAELSDYIVNSVEEAALTVLEEGENIKSKDSSWFYCAMQHYIDTQLEQDIRMKEYIDNDEKLQHRIRSIRNMFK